MTRYDRYGTAYAKRRGQDRHEWERGDDSIVGFRGSYQNRSRDSIRRYGGDRPRDGWGPDQADYTGRGDGWRDEDRMGRERTGEWGRRSEGDRGYTYYGSDDYHDRLPIDETSHLIASNKVEGTTVYGRDGERLGSIYNFMVDKFLGQVEYAVMVYGGVLGLGERYFPLPWQVLDYDSRRGGYRVDMSERDLRDAPSFDRKSEPHFDRDYGSRVHNYYGLRY